MGNTLNTTFVVLLVITLILFTFYYMIDSTETEEVSEFKEIIGKMQSFEVSHSDIILYHPTMKNTKRYDDKLFVYLEHVQEQRDKTFMKGKVFLKQK